MSGRLVLVRHGQSYGNVDKRLDTRPPGAELTPQGREQARTFARGVTQAPGLLARRLGSSLIPRTRPICSTPRRIAPGT